MAGTRNQVALELGERPDGMEDELPGERARVDALGQGGETDTTSLSLLGNPNQIDETAPEAVEPPHDQGIPLAQGL